jgi:methylenetetrahydrofolate reductase (NADPH)
MRQSGNLEKKIDSGDFVITAEFLPAAGTDDKAVETAAGFFKKGVTAVNVADNPHGPVMSSLAGALILARAGIEPVYQMVTRDRNRIAIQSDILGAAAMGIGNILCLSGHHQSLTGSPESANVYDIDSVQLIAAVARMRDAGELLDGTKITGPFTMLIGAVANPDMRPLELNVLRLAKKVAAGARFIQTQAVFDADAFAQWMKAAGSRGVTSKAAVLAGVLPLRSAREAEELKAGYTDISIPDAVVERLRAAGDEAAQKKEGLAICLEIIKRIRTIEGLRGIHILSGGREEMVPELISAAGL